MDKLPTEPSHISSLAFRAFYASKIDGIKKRASQLGVTDLAEHEANKIIKELWEDLSTDERNQWDPPAGAAGVPSEPLKPAPADGLKTVDSEEQQQAQNPSIKRKSSVSSSQLHTAPTKRPALSTSAFTDAPLTSTASKKKPAGPKKKAPAAPDDLDTSSLPTAPQEKVKISCAECKKSHLRCSITRPCERCKHLGRPCIDTEQKKRGRPPKKLALPHTAEAQIGLSPMVESSKRKGSTQSEPERPGSGIGYRGSEYPGFQLDGVHYPPLPPMQLHPPVPVYHAYDYPAPSAPDRTLRPDVEVGVSPYPRDAPKFVPRLVKNDEPTSDSGASQFEPSPATLNGSQPAQQTSDKSQKNEKKARKPAPPSPVEGQCHFLVKRKNRYCNLGVKPGKMFCGQHADMEPQNENVEHLQEGESASKRPKVHERVKCTWDPSQYVSANDGERQQRLKIEATVESLGRDAGGSPEGTLKRSLDHAERGYTTSTDKIDRRDMEPRSERAERILSSDLPVFSEYRPDRAGGGVVRTEESGSSSVATVAVSKLASHLNKCNARPKPKPLFHVENVNDPRASGEDLRSAGSDVAKKQEHGSFDARAYLSQLTLDAFIGLVEQVEELYSTLFPNGLERRDYGGDEGRKHLRQQRSILENMRKLGSVSPEDHGDVLIQGNVYVELGCGKAALSGALWDTVWGEETGFSALNKGERRLTKDVNHSDGSRGAFVLIDRQNFRNKIDSSITHPSGPNVWRHQMDIKDLDLGLHPAIVDEKKKNVVVYGKHLCGAATELGLECWKKVACRERQPQDVTRHYLFVALCCHHLMQYSLYPCAARNWLASVGFADLRGFELLRWMTSWGTCGFESRGAGEERNRTERGDVKENGDAESDTDEHTIPIDNASSIADCQAPWLSVSTSRLASLGIKCKRILDFGRVVALKDSLKNSKNIWLGEYVEPTVSRENACLAVWL
ncbi:hypothetical protein HDU85_006021 [Gaertneriomyces sp. JEL0708]|nr:hypothetical protein HDU85_006021 [Gaertneriomyces sp. JEL0708]